MAKSSNYSILVDAQLNLDDIEKKLKSKKYEIPLDTSSIKSGKKDIDDAVQSTKNLMMLGKTLSLHLMWQMRYFINLPLLSRIWPVKYMNLTQH